jgi:YihY family inner membrane protein
VRRAGRALGAFYTKAYRENVTGLSGMVAYNLLLSVFPLALLALFVASQVLRSADIEQSIFDDLARLFPSTAESTIENVLHRVESSSTSIGIVALVTSVWFGSSFWGALDTAFCRIYHVDCRTWLQQKRFALAMLGLVLLFMVATVLVPAAQSLLVKGTQGLPFGLDQVRAVLVGVTLLFTLLLIFGILCVVYWRVPNRSIPWRAIWPGALLATIAIAIVDYGFPLYLSGVSTIAKLGTTLVFIVIVLLWFYAIAIIILGGAVVNALRFELHDTGDMTLE